MQRWRQCLSQGLTPFFYFSTRVKFLSWGTLYKLYSALSVDGLIAP